MKCALLYLVKTLHFSLTCFIALAAYFTNNIHILSTVLMCVVLLFYSWYMFDMCFITQIEEYLGASPQVYDDASKKSFMATAIQSCTGLDDRATIHLFTAVPLLSAVVCIYKINRYCHGDHAVFAGEMATMVAATE